MAATRNNRTAVSGTRLAPRKAAPASRARTAFIDPDTKENQGWRKDAECRKHDPEVWFSDSPSTRDYAVRICFACPVREACLAWANETRQAYGVWGGIDFGADIKPWHAKRKKASEK